MINPYQFNNPYNMYQTQQIGSQGLVRVNGIDGAKAYQMGANSTVALFDAGNDLMYIKTTDGAGFPTIRTFGFSEITSDVAKNETSEFVTKKEMEEYVKHIVQSNKSNATVQPRTDKFNKTDA